MQKLFSYPIVVDDLPSAPRKYTLKATPKDLVFLAEVLKVPAVKSCQSVIDLRLDRKKHRLDVSGPRCGGAGSGKRYQPGIV